MRRHNLLFLDLDPLAMLTLRGNRLRQEKPL